MQRNPFTPTFGVTPPMLVGRDEELAEFEAALAEGPGSPARAVLVTGARGTGKTVLLNAVEEAAAEAGWLVASATTRPGLAEELTCNILPRLLARHDPDATAVSLGGASVSVLGSGAGFTRVQTERHPVRPTFRSELESLAEIQAAKGAGVLVSLDEIHRDALGDLREIAQGIQHAFRAGLEVAFVAAGLPSAVEGLLNEGATTFLRRAERFTLGRVRDADVAPALREPITRSGREIDPEALDLAVAAAGGYPFMLQVIGHQVWAANREAAVIDQAQTRAGLLGAQRRAARLLHAPILTDLSQKDRAFLDAMSVDTGPSRLRDIAGRMGVDPDYASQYRARLIAAGAVEPAGHGLVTFAIPLLRDYLRRQSSNGLPDRPGV